jgi:hypothetical protein
MKMDSESIPSCEVCGKPSYCMFRERIEFVDEDGKGFFSIPDDDIHYTCRECYQNYPKVKHQSFISLKQLRYVLDCSSCDEKEVTHMAMEPLLKNCLKGIQASLQDESPIRKVASPRCENVISSK